MKQLTHKLLIAFLTLSFSTVAIAQVDKKSELFKILKNNDSLIFKVGFNTCDMSQFENLIFDDLEFYHDKSGVINSKLDFIKVMKNGICNAKNNSKLRRELKKNSLEVFPLYNNNKLYGAIQQGEHLFYETVNNKETLNGNAKFSHLWLLENNKWKLKRVLSYNHIATKY